MKNYGLVRESVVHLGAAALGEQDPARRGAEADPIRPLGARPLQGGGSRRRSSSSTSRTTRLRGRRRCVTSCCRSGSSCARGRPTRATPPSTSPTSPTSAHPSPSLEALAGARPAAAAAAEAAAAAAAGATSAATTAAGATAATTWRAGPAATTATVEGTAATTATAAHARAPATATAATTAGATAATTATVIAATTATGARARARGTATGAGTVIAPATTTGGATGRPTAGARRFARSPARESESKARTVPRRPTRRRRGRRDGGGDEGGLSLSDGGLHGGSGRLRERIRTPRACRAVWLLFTHKIRHTFGLAPTTSPRLHQLDSGVTPCGPPSSRMTTSLGFSWIDCASWRISSRSTPLGGRGRSRDVRGSRAARAPSISARSRPPPRDAASRRSLGVGDVVWAAPTDRTDRPVWHPAHDGCSREEHQDRFKVLLALSRTLWVRGVGGDMMVRLQARGERYYVHGLS